MTGALSSVSRRDSLLGLGAIAVAALGASLGRRLRTPNDEYGPPLSVNEQLLVAAMAERIIPTTDTPGALSRFSIAFRLPAAGDLIAAAGMAAMAR